jgi:predicted CopG family antitoxin
MATKTISIMDDAYERLLRVKLKDESFSDVVRRLTEKKKGDLLKYAGILSHLPSSYWKKMEKFHEERRKLNLKRQEKRLKWFQGTA